MASTNCLLQISIGTSQYSLPIYAITPVQFHPDLYGSLTDWKRPVLDSDYNSLTPQELTVVNGVHRHQALFLTIRVMGPPLVLRW